MFCSELMMLVIPEHLDIKICRTPDFGGGSV